MITGPTVEALFRDHIEAAARECFCRLIAVEGAMRTLGFLSDLEAGWHKMPVDFEGKISRMDFIRIGREEVVAFRLRKKKS